MGGDYTPCTDEHELIDVTSLGRGIEIVSIKKVDFTMERAHEFLSDLVEFAAERPLRSHHVDYLVDTMRRGTFRTELVGLACCWLKDQLIRVNGQHCCWARFTVGGEWEPPTKVTLYEYRASTEEDLRLLYSTFDRGAVRTKAHVSMAHLQGLPVFKNVKLGTLKRLPAALSLWLWEGDNERALRDGDAVAVLLKTDHRDLALKVAALLDDFKERDARHLLRAPVMAAMFATITAAPRKAEEFWRAVITGEGFTSGDARNKLRTTLLESSIASTNGRNRCVSREVMYRQCIVAWNWWRRGESPRILRVVENHPRPAALS